jgi:hypothetical protein
MTVQMEWRDLENLYCNASHFLNVQRATGDVMDFTYKYKNSNNNNKRKKKKMKDEDEEEEEEEEEEEVGYDSIIS